MPTPWFNPSLLRSCKFVLPCFTNLHVNKSANSQGRILEIFNQGNTVLWQFFWLTNKKKLMTGPLQATSLGILFILKPPKPPINMRVLFNDFYGSMNSSGYGDEWGDFTVHPTFNHTRTLRCKSLWGRGDAHLYDSFNHTCKLRCARSLGNGDPWKSTCLNKILATLLHVKQVPCQLSKRFSFPQEWGLRRCIDGRVRPVE